MSSGGAPGVSVYFSRASAKFVGRNTLSKEQDRQFFDTFMIVLGALVAFTIIVYIIANVIGDRTQGRHVAENPLRAQLVAERLTPVAQVAVEGQAPPAASRASNTAPAVASTATMSTLR